MGRGSWEGAAGLSYHKLGELREHVTPQIGVRDTAPQQAAF